MLGSWQARVIGLHILVGAVSGILLLHPVIMTIYWFEFHGNMVEHQGSLWSFLFDRLWLAYSPEMFPMNGTFAVIGGGVGLGFGLYYLALTGQQRKVQYLEEELAEDLPSLINAGEGERVEFKASLRWDIRQGCLNRELESVVAKTIAGFLNHRGGSLLIGVTDSGEIVGLDQDYQTLKHKDRDGFERYVIDLVETRLGGDLCALIHLVFHREDGKEVCRIVVEPSRRPVYYEGGKGARYFLRTGNSTRELDTREALEHIARRWPSRRQGARVQ